ncbi:Coenzyme PQQ synthesis protein E [Candidatus Bilamarchaeum dharawalense]|uniref:Coenzyme PQQ synthesis protein E n=1 Tax=Candidatus Bilamarchaeum dharawalense TaxID=2885759 RepID=A0A5E4LVA1_9ARCH|nr:Coenzyme PQQ synthesis protein E [Candidatus Bilamarchaeum dharawalense]
MLGWEATKRCIFDCVHCGVTKHQLKNELTTAQIKSLINQAADFGISIFAITGGEPLIRKDLVEIIAYASKKGLKVTLATNGLLLDKSLVDRLIKAGVVTFMLSLDGPKEIHNKIRRNSKSFDHVFNAIKLIRGKSAVVISTTLMALNQYSLPDLHNLLVNEKIDLWRLNPLLPIGNALDNKVSLTRPLNEILGEIHALRKRKQVKIMLCESLPYTPGYTVRDLPVYCPVGFTVMTIGVDGTIRGCPEQGDSEDWVEGNGLTEPLQIIWQKKFSRYRNYEWKSDPSCAKCNATKLCMGGCWILRNYKKQCIKIK